MTSDARDLDHLIDAFVETAATAPPADAPAPAPAVKMLTRKRVVRDAHNRIAEVIEESVPVAVARSADRAADAVEDLLDTCPSLIVRIAKSEHVDAADVAQLQRSIRILLGEEP